MAHQCHNRAIDPALLLNERATGTTQNADIVGATAGGTALVLDLSQMARQYAGAPGATDTSAPISYAKFDIVIDWTGCQSGVGQVYYWRLEGNKTDPTFAATNFRLLEKTFGATLNGTAQPYNTPIQGRLVLSGDNVAIDNAGGTTSADSVVYSTCRYLRCVVFCSNVAHTTGFAYRATFVPKA